MHRVLIANRGEIAIRLARAAREEGLIPLGVFSEVDRNALHVEAMTQARCIGPADPRESYLHIEHILTAARELGADAIHPGYGFLSENAEFAQAVGDAGLVFVGPPPAVLAAAGDKSIAKRHARTADLAVIPGYDGDEQTNERLRSEIAVLGLPLLIKARAGGGGRGMRIVRTISEFDEALSGARSEALIAFGNGSVLLERYLEQARHIEIQILADTHDTVLAIGERECSIQRRHQKIIEESPSSALDARLRLALCDSAVRFARSVGYRNAGTVEFLLDPRGGIFFLEMNARLQVEHPVTELVYGIDLPRWQFRIARGEALTLTQEEIIPRCWAIEARLCAEDAAHGFLPSGGMLQRWQMPSGPHIRVDTGFEAGREVPLFYDSLLAKIIVSETTRASAISELAHALGNAEVSGLESTLDYLRTIIRHPLFRSGQTTTAFLEEYGDDLLASARTRENDATTLACAAVLRDPRTWRIASVGIPITLRRERHRRSIRATKTHDDSWRLDGDLQGNLRANIEGELLAVQFDARHIFGKVELEDLSVVVLFDGDRYRFEIGDPPWRNGEGSTAGVSRADAVTAPMPGTIRRLQVSVGDRVSFGATLLVLEAMKMEHRIQAPRDAIISSVKVEPGSVVGSGATLVEFEPSRANEDVPLS
ncbi:MAG TPA: biotin carboxylase N-terminal domain-containing protein [Candidatus Baltobacteraceae bacterium]|nr:biotin carboxylase N-terminal domain-containing protein [Candidatus Baltobacteraceae bacterium]